MVGIKDIGARRLLAWRSKRSWPVISIIAAVALFVASSIVSAVIEHYVQKPLNEDSASVISAVFQVPFSIEGDHLPFRLRGKLECRER